MTLYARHFEEFEQHGGEKTFLKSLMTLTIENIQEKENESLVDNF